MTETDNENAKLTLHPVDLNFKNSTGDCQGGQDDGDQTECGSDVCSLEN